MNIFEKIKEKLTSIYKKEVIDKKELLDFLDKKLPNKKKFSVKDVVEKIKDFVKK